jgi:hypothetical protein
MTHTSKPPVSVDVTRRTWRQVGRSLVADMMAVAALAATLALLWWFGGMS